MSCVLYTKAVARLPLRYLGFLVNNEYRDSVLRCRVEEPKTLRIETAKASTRGGEWEGCFLLQPTEALPACMVRDGATAAKAFCWLFIAEALLIAAISLERSVKIIVSGQNNTGTKISRCPGVFLCREFGTFFSLPLWSRRLYVIGLYEYFWLVISDKYNLIHVSRKWYTTATHFVTVHTPTAGPLV